MSHDVRKGEYRLTVKTAARGRSTHLKVCQLLLEFQSGVSVEDELGGQFVGQLPQLLHHCIVDGHGD